MDSMASNPVFAGGLSFAIVGSMVGTVVWAYKQVYSYVMNRFMVTITLVSTDEGFRALLLWLAAKQGNTASAKVSVTVKRSERKQFWRSQLNMQHSLEFLPGAGVHTFWYKGRLMWLSRVAEEPTTQGWDKQVVKFETLTLSYFGRDAGLAERLVAEAVALQEEKDHDMTDIYVLHEYGWCWQKANSIKPRSMQSVILDRGITSRVLSDVRHFFNSEAFYRERGIPWRRGYLLHGPPGCGKTSIVTALAGELKLNVCILQLSSKSLDDEDLRLRLHDAPPRSMILLEDVDAVFTQRENSSSGDGAWGGQRGVTFSGLLNAIDGVAASEGRILFATTNHIEKLDPALIRPGRCDVHVEVRFASADQVQEMFRWFFGSQHEAADARAKRLADRADTEGEGEGEGKGAGEGKEDGGDAASVSTTSTAAGGSDGGGPGMPAAPTLRRQLSAEFRLAVPEGKVSMAALQGHFLRYKGSPDEALRHAQALVQQQAAAQSQASDVHRWLQRLGCEQYYKGFERHKIFSVQDLADVDEGSLESFGVSVLGHRRRIAGMLAGRADVRAQFDLATPSQAEAVFLQFFSDQSRAGRPEASPLDAGAAVGGAPGSRSSRSSGTPKGASRRAGAGATLARQPSASDVDAATRTVKLAKAFRDGVPPDTLSVAQVLKHCAAFASRSPGKLGDPEGAVAALPALVSNSRLLRDRRADDSVMASLNAARPVLARGASSLDGAAPLSPTPDASAADGAFEDDCEDLTIDTLDAMPIPPFLARLGLAKQEAVRAAFDKASLHRVRDLRAQRGSLASYGIDSLGQRQLVEAVLDLAPEGLEMFRVVCTAAQAREVFEAVFPLAAAGRSTTGTATAARANADSFASGVRLGVSSVAQLRAHCEHHRDFDEAGCDRADATGARAARCAASVPRFRAPHGGDASARDPGRGQGDDELTWQDVERMSLRVLLTRLGHASQLGAAVKAGCTTVARLMAQGARAAMTLGVTQTRDAALVNAVATRQAHALRSLRLVSTCGEAEALFRAVFAHCPASATGLPSGCDWDVAPLAVEFGAALPKRVLSFAQTLKYLRGHVVRAAGGKTGGAEGGVDGDAAADAPASAAETDPVAAVDKAHASKAGTIDAMREAALAAVAGAAKAGDAPSKPGATAKGKEGAAGAAGAAAGGAGAAGSSSAAGSAESGDKAGPLEVKPLGPALEAMGMGSYAASFAAQGFESVSDAAGLSSEQLRELGVSRVGHVKRLQRGLRAAA